MPRRFPLLKYVWMSETLHDSVYPFDVAEYIEEEKNINCSVDSPVSGRQVYISYRDSIILFVWSDNSEVFAGRPGGGAAGRPLVNFTFYEPLYCR